MGENGSCCTPGERRCFCPDNPEKFARISFGLTDGMIRIEGGVFRMGTNDPVGFPADGEGPVRNVAVDSFWVVDGKT